MPNLKKIQVFWIILFAGIFVFCLGARLFAQDALFKRTVLAVYDSAEEFNSQEDNNLIHNNAEMVLNYLGMKVRYCDVNKRLPSREDTEDVSAIISWFQDDKVSGAKTYVQWLIGQLKESKRLIILGNFGAFEDRLTGESVSQGLIDEVFNYLGLEYIGDWSENPFVIEVTKKDKEMVEFERTLEGDVSVYERVVSLEAQNKIYLELNRTDIPEGKSAAVVTSPHGGFVMSGYDFYFDYISFQRRWRINPFLFFEEALGLKNTPRYDATTIFGRRIFYSHIDGDGFRSVSQIDNSSYCAEIIKDGILKKYDLPITASVIVADISSKYYGSEKMVKLSREIFALENVEAGVHSFSHPLDWQRQLTVFQIQGYSRPLLTNEDFDILSESRYGAAMIISASQAEFLKKEINEAVDYVNNNLLGKNKRVALYQWTGNCRPQEAAIKSVDDLGIANINGGDSRFDESIPSYTGVSGLSRVAGDYIQPYASNTNENIYTNSWSGPFDAYKYVIHTFKETEQCDLFKAPARRVSAINVYYHFYSGEKKDSLEAVKEAYDFALSQEIIPVFTSYYSRLVLDLFSARIFSLPDGGWEFRNYGKCNTVRFDHTSLFPDLSKSSGILGFKYWKGYLYLHLAQDNVARLYLTKEPPKEVYLSEASCLVSDLKISKEKLSFTADAFRKSIVKFANFAPKQAYKLTVYSLENNTTVNARQIAADAEGTLEIAINLKGKFRAEIEKKG